MRGGLDERPEYGPSGYLPEKATRRARKIVLRAPLGLQWLVAAVGVGVVLVAVALILLLVRPGSRPGPPFEAVGPLESVEAARLDVQRGVLYVGAAGRVRSFVVPVGDVPFYCAASGRLESRLGRVWSLTGRALDGGPSLEQHPTLVGADGVVYVDFTRTLPGPPPQETQATSACFPPGAQRSRTRGA
ncbi:MAG: hypothetical protein M3O70_02830 [Actinomycetota bacterium]|nr:hypothetical protein [Actinomycetota bacterium]